MLLGRFRVALLENTATTSAHSRGAKWSRSLRTLLLTFGVQADGCQCFAGNAGLFFSKSFRVNLPALSVLIHHIKTEVVIVAVVPELYVSLFVALEVFLR